MIFDAVTKTQAAVTKTPTAMETVTKTQAERAATYRARKRAAQ
jgi:hypothetical protein